MKWRLSTPELRTLVACLGEAVGRGEEQYRALRDAGQALLEVAVTRRQVQREKLAAGKRAASAAAKREFARVGHKGWS